MWVLLGQLAYRRINIFGWYVSMAWADCGIKTSQKSYILCYVNDCFECTSSGIDENEPEICGSVIHL